MNESSSFASVPYDYERNCKPPLSPDFMSLVSYCYILPFICAMGLLGNIANLITLFSRQLKAVSYVYLRGLGVADLLCMVFVLVFVSFEILNASNYEHFVYSYGVTWYKAHLMLPLINWSVSAGILIIVALTLERYLSISWPLLFRTWNSPRRATGIITAAYIIPLILYIPMYWQNEVAVKQFSCVVLNSTKSQKIFLSAQNLSRDEYFIQRWTMTDNKFLLHNTWYKAYKFSREIILKLIPIVALTFLNLRIIFVFRKVSKRKRRISSSSNQQEQRSLLILLAGIVVLFFICNIPAAINLVFITEAMKLKPSYRVFRAIANLLEITNHALNFYNFCVCSSDYRMTFLRKFPCVKAVQESAENLKRRLSNSLMRGRETKKMSIRCSTTEVGQAMNTSSVRSQLGKSDRRYLRRAVSSDALLRTEQSLRAYRKFRVGTSTSSINENTALLSVKANDCERPRWRNDRRKFYASAETFQIFDTIHEDSNQAMPTHSTGSKERGNDHRNSVGTRPTVSAIEFGEIRDEIDSTFFMPEPKISAKAQLTASTLVPSICINGLEEDSFNKIINYNPDTDVLL